MSQRLDAQKAAHLSWANTPDRSARTKPARDGLNARFLREANGDPQRAESLRRAHFADLALKSAKARRKKAEIRRRIRKAEAELEASGDAA